MSQRSERKKEHLALARMLFNNKQKNSFDDMFLLRPALPESRVNAGIMRTSFLGKQVAAPFFIEAMTGGSRESLKINRALAQAAQKNSIALALGSASILAEEANQLASFTVARIQDPDGVIIANVNPATKPALAEKIVQEIKADGLQIHLNAMQETAMPEGDRNFYWLDNLLAIRQEVDVPIIIKEVGFGLDQDSMIKLSQNGFNCFDLGGAGGTNFAEIENKRSEEDTHYLANTGLPTLISAEMAKSEHLNFLVSGGVRNPLDILKSLVLGGKAVGIAGVFLHTLQSKGEQALQSLIASWKNQLARLLAVYGISRLSDCSKIRYSLSLELKNQLQQLLK